MTNFRQASKLNTITTKGRQASKLNTITTKGRQASKQNTITIKGRKASKQNTITTKGRLASKMITKKGRQASKLSPFQAFRNSRKSLMSSSLLVMMRVSVFLIVVMNRILSFQLTEDSQSKLWRLRKCQTKKSPKSRLSIKIIMRQIKLESKTNSSDAMEAILRTTQRLTTMSKTTWAIPP